MSAVLVDLGGTHIRCGLARDCELPQVLYRGRIHNFIHGVSDSQIWEGVITTITDFAAGVRQSLPAGAPVVISFPGPVLERSRIMDAPTVIGSKADFPDLQLRLSERTGRPVHIVNDISAAAWHFSRNLAADRFMVVTVSSGIGSKIFDRRHSRGVIDDLPYAGEIGHVKVDETADAPMCDCGGHGHLGAISSGRGIERFARRLAHSDSSFIDSLCVRHFGATASSLTNEQHLVPAALLGDAWALRVIRECTKPLARVLLQTVIAAGVEQVVVIGGFALGLGERYRAMLQDEILTRCDYRIASSRLKDLIVMGDEDACLLGAAAYASHVCRS